MKDDNVKLFIMLMSIAFFFTLYVLFFGSAFGSAVEKITWCHTEPNGNQQTLELPQQALENAGHVNAQGNPLHAGDHAGACEEVTPTSEPTNTPTPTQEAATPSATLEPTREVTPTSTPSATPTSTNTPSTGGTGVSDGRSSCPECTQAPKYENKTLLPLTNPGK